jgi:hypothetical protein
VILSHNFVCQIICNILVTASTQKIHKIAVIIIKSGFMMIVGRKDTMVFAKIENGKYKKFANKIAHTAKTHKRKPNWQVRFQESFKNWPDNLLIPQIINVNIV